jgi:phospholipid/cholesterol/gamma-HCH transport system ATP-binding protein
MIEAIAVSHSFGEKEVLSNISFSMEPGEILAVMGSSGGGKTTLLKCMSGLLKPTSGEILVGDVSVTKEPEKARGMMGLVFQYAALFDYLNVEDNILFGLERQTKILSRKRKELAADFLAKVNLAPETAKLKPSELSGGMRKRVGLARALAMEPKVLFYDEPTSGLDPITAYAIDELIVETRNQLQMTSVVVSHDVSSVMRVADRVAFLSSGNLLFLGSRKEFGETQVPEIKDLVQKARSETFV